MAAGSRTAGRAAAGKREYTVEALAKGLRVLSLFSQTRTSVRLSDIAAETGLPLPTAYRIVVTLVSEGYLEHLPDGNYSPSIKVLTLGYSALRGQSLVELADAPLRNLAASSGETVNLGVLLDGLVLYLVRIRNTDLVTANLQVGSTLPASTTSMGKVLLAYLDDDERERRLATLNYGSDAGPNALRTAAELEPRLAAIRAQGFGLQDEELAFGLRSVAAPIYDAEGKVIAAANIAVRSLEWNVERIVAELAPQIVTTCREISQLLGHR
jgi:IclR family pca regulon transcriptional regulator